VAIATALMPPLCTAGYGIATGQLNFFLGAMYLFTINTIFIAMASVWISQILKFPIRSDLDPGKKRRINQLISIIIVIVLLPSIYFGYQLVQKEKFNLNAKEFITKTQSFEGNILLNHSVDSENQVLNLVFGGKKWTKTQIEALVLRAKQFNLKEENIKIQKGLTFDNSENLQPLEIYNKLTLLEDSLQTKTRQLSELTNKNQLGKALLSELNIIWPEINGCSFLESEIHYIDSLKSANQSIVILEISGKFNNDEKVKIEKWLVSRTRSENLMVIFDSQ
jgi:uncharacterized membrane protein